MPSRFNKRVHTCVKTLEIIDFDLVTCESVNSFMLQCIEAELCLTKF